MRSDEVVERTADSDNPYVAPPDHQAPGDQATKSIGTLLVHPTNNLITQFLRYAVVGGLAFVVDFGFLIILTKKAGLDYRISAAIGFLLGLVTNYVLSISWVFQNRTLKDKRVEFAIFAIIGIIGLGLTEVILYFATSIIESMSLGAGLQYLWLSKMIAVAIVLFFNFGARKAMLFRADGNAVPQK